MSATPNETLPAARRRLFASLAALIPVAFFVLLEIGLRLSGFGSSYPLFVPVSGAEEYLAMNPEMARRYFRRAPRVPTGMHDVFRAWKDSTTYRVFVQGGSTAAGYPYYYGGSFSRMLEQRLQQTWPERSVEVVNTAAAAVNSHTLLDRVPEIVAEAPDAVLIYAGHNEFYGALGVASAESLGRRRSVVQLYLRLQRLRVFQALSAILGRLAEAAATSAADERTLMERMVGQQSIAYESALYRRGLVQFRGNLRAMLERYTARDIPVYVATLASNERGHPPFMGEPARAQRAWAAHHEAALRLAQRGSIDSALVAIDRAVAVDTLAARSHFSRARILEWAHRPEEARQAYTLAKDLDRLRFRASEHVNEIIRDEAARSGATVVDVRSALAARSRDGIIGSDLMLEHLHPNVEGYFVMADAFYRALVSDSARYVSAERARREVLFTAVDSLFGAYRLRQLLGSWPFKPAGTPLATLDTVTARNPVEEIALDLFRGRRTWYEATAALRSRYAERGDYHHALQAALAMVQQYPYLGAPYLDAARILVEQGRLEEALPYLEATADLQESADAHYLMGNIHLAYGRAEQAIWHLRRAVDLEPESEVMLFQLSQAFVLTRRWSEAAEVLDRLLRVAPRHGDGAVLQAFVRAQLADRGK